MIRVIRHSLVTKMLPKRHVQQADHSIMPFLAFKQIVY
jgi:hypothetical protein